VRGERHLTSKVQFESVYRKGRSWACDSVVLRAIPNDLEICRYGITVSRRIGKAVVRNLVKRRLREILRQAPLKAGWDIVVIARVPAARASYRSLDKSTKSLLFRAGLYVGDYEGVRPGAN
jgi:ribonuclease P protein component